MRAVLGGILSRYNQIRHEIATGTFEPILWSDADGTVIGTDWAEGFMQGVGLRATKWERLFRSEDGAGLIFPILALCGDENGESLLGLEPADEDCIGPKQRHSCPAAHRRSTFRPAFNCAMRQLSPALVIGSQGESRKGIAPPRARRTRT